MITILERTIKEFIDEHYSEDPRVKVKRWYMEHEDGGSYLRFLNRSNESRSLFLFYQETCGNIEETALGEIRKLLAATARSYKQESIAIVVGDVEFVAAAEE